MMFTKRLFRFLLYVSFIFAVPVFAHAAILSVSPATGSVAVGSTLTVTIQANTQGSASDGIDVRYLNFNPALLQVIDENTSVSGVQITPGALMPNTPTNIVNNTTGQISFSQVPTGGTTFTNTSAQTLATVRFNVIAAGTAALTFNFTSGSTADCNIAAGGSDLLTSVANGSYTLATANISPTVSAISTNVSDVDAGTPGIQYYEGTTVIYSGSASDANGDPITWTWLYTINGGPEIQFSTGTGAVQNAVFTYGAGTAGSTYRWILRATDGKSSPVQSTLDVMIIAVPDTTPPTITNIASSGITTSGATITWTTNEPADSQVEYGPTTSYGQSSLLNTSLVLAHSVSLSSLSAGTLYNFRVKSRDSAGNLAISLNTTFTTSSAPDIQPPNTVANLSFSNIQTTSATLTWTAPSDPPSNSAAASYDIRYSTSPITSSNFASASQATGEPTPSSPGATQSYILAGLNSDTTYYAAIKSSDTIGNTSTISNVITITTPIPIIITVPPVISNITTSSITSSGATIMWTTNELSTHQVEYGLTTSYGSQTIENTTLMTMHTQLLSGLSADTLYHYRVKSKDASGNLAVSGDNTFTTLPLPDTIPPAAITTLSSGNVTQNSVTLSWIAPGDDGIIGTAASYEIRYSTSPITTANFALATLVTNPPVPLLAGASQSLILGSFTPNTTYYVAIKATDDAGNVSLLSNILSFTTLPLTPPLDTTPPVISNITVSGSVALTIVTWTTNEPSDSKVLYGKSSLLLGNQVSSLNLVTTHSLGLSNLRRKTIYYYQVVSKDAAGNTANSTTGSFKTGNGKTSPITNLQAAQGSVILTWTVPQDDFITKVIIYRSTTGYPDTMNSSDLLSTLTNLANTTYTDAAVSNGATYYYSVFAVDDDNIISNPAHVSFTPQAPVVTTSRDERSSSSGGGSGGGSSSSYVPSASSGFVALGGSNQVVLRWKNSVDPSFIRTRVIRKSSSAPISVNDGEVLYEGEAQEFNDTKVVPGGTYYYAVFSLDRALHSSSLVSAKAIVGELSAEDIMKRIAEVVVLKPQPVSLFPTLAAYAFTRNLKIGTRGEDVRQLQKFLNSKGFLITSAGDGSLGYETDFFGSLTKIALIRFQETYAADVLMPAGLVKGSGFFGQLTQSKIRQLSQ